MPLNYSKWDQLEVSGHIIIFVHNHLTQGACFRDLVIR